jgi:hypothetical protein
MDCAYAMKKNCKPSMQNTPDSIEDLGGSSNDIDSIGQSSTLSHGHKSFSGASGDTMSSIDHDLHKMSIDEQQAATSSQYQNQVGSPPFMTAQISDILEVPNEDGGGDCAMASSPTSEGAKFTGTADNYQDKFANNHIRHFRQALKQNNNRNKKNNQICLQRLSQRIKKTGGFFWSGYMFYHTNQNPEVS